MAPSKRLIRVELGLCEIGAKVDYFARKVVAFLARRSIQNDCDLWPIEGGLPFAAPLVSLHKFALQVATSQRQPSGVAIRSEPIRSDSIPSNQIGSDRFSSNWIGRERSIADNEQSLRSLHSQGRFHASPFPTGLFGENLNFNSSLVGK